eukprot:jgi/Chrzof1/6260/Cz17g17230.t1
MLHLTACRPAFAFCRWGGYKVVRLHDPSFSFICIITVFFQSACMLSHYALCMAAHASTTLISQQCLSIYHYTITACAIMSYEYCITLVMLAQ